MIALVILASTSNLRNSTTLQGVMHTVCGVWGERITSLITALYCFGTCLTFLIIIGDQFDRAFDSLIGPDFCKTWFLNRNFIMPVTSVLLILPLCFTSKIDFLKYASVMGVFTILYIVIIIISQYFSGNYKPGEIKTKPDNILDIFNVIPVICFGYQCHVSVIPIYSCMKHRNLKHFTIASSTAITACVFVYTGAATFGYLTFGSNVSNDILENYSASNPWVLIALISMALKTYTTYPILLFCGREAISTIIKDLFVTEETRTKEKFRRYIIAIVWFALSVVLGICLLQSTLMLDPGLVKLEAKLKIGLATVFLILGSFLFGVVLTQGVERDMTSSGSKSLLCVP
ncbi:putative sodium-coupled neutral amino acid transporter 7 isoform X2 [Eurytemora carolleeae]|uniref:putative sodium-coupled neutral amino acid transporter 7 isoform X2 n=1 Tax=Eurytemora carolleeae TaxID=1294199 RepID=UPI000C7654CA|nr:putative sodium-coupled neutral amino acid transporter 7 isoform X2 [Eurytemora carolleeae]|eukprot:XP_023348632.1 putative sodium-coupled neutral amino acid transporter 7 isoform X2 [Eurytemora affinis]